MLQVQLEDGPHAGGFVVVDDALRLDDLILRLEAENRLAALVLRLRAYGRWRELLVGPRADYRSRA